MKPKLIVHIGAGKTGSSSIQFTLRENQVDLNSHGFKYLGLMLEHLCQKNDYSWSFPEGSRNLLDLPIVTASDQVYAALRGELDELESRGLHSAIWSNEWMFTRDMWFIPALKRIQADGNEVEIVCYVRRHDKWARSAYAQWGIKHKTNRGPVQPFSEWATGRTFQFFPAVEPWLSGFPTGFKLLNFDSAGDVVEHFCKTIGYKPEQIIQENTTPHEEVMAAWAVFNSQYEKEVLPVHFTSATRGSGILEEKSLRMPELKFLYPNSDDFSRIRVAAESDCNRLNQILQSQGEERLENGPLCERDLSLDPWKMNLMLMKIIFSLESRIAAIEKEKL